MRLWLFIALVVVGTSALPAREEHNDLVDDKRPIDMLHDIVYPPQKYNKIRLGGSSSDEGDLKGENHDLDIDDFMKNVDNDKRKRRDAVKTSLFNSDDGSDDDSDDDDDSDRSRVRVPRAAGGKRKGGRKGPRGDKNREDLKEEFRFGSDEFDFPGDIGEVDPLPDFPDFGDMREEIGFCVVDIEDDMAERELRTTVTFTEDVYFFKLMQPLKVMRPERRFKRGGGRGGRRRGGRRGRRPNWMPGPSREFTITNRLEMPSHDHMMMFLYKYDVNNEPEFSCSLVTDPEVTPGVTAPPATTNAATVPVVVTDPPTTTIGVGPPVAVV